MVLRHKAKHPPVSYSVGEKVLVKPSAKDCRVARGGHKLMRITPQHSTVLDVNTTLQQYKVIVDGRKKCMDAGWRAGFTEQGFWPHKAAKKEAGGRDSTGREEWYFQNLIPEKLLSC